MGALRVTTKGTVDGNVGPEMNSEPTTHDTYGLAMTERLGQEALDSPTGLL